MFQERLQQISNRIAGTEALSLVAQDGMQVETLSLRSDLDLDALAAELMTQVRAITQNHQDLEVGRVGQLAVITDRFTLLVSAVSEEYFLMLVLAAGANVGRARFELRRARLLFEGEL